MDSDQLKMFQERLRNIVAQTDDFMVLNEIRKSLYSADRNLRGNYQPTEQYRKDLLENQILLTQVRRKLQLRVLQGQKDGLVKTRQNTRALYPTRMFSENTAEYHVMQALGRLTDEQFEALIRKGREIGNLSTGELQRMLGIKNKEDAAREEQVYQMALLPGATRREISTKVGISVKSVQFILKRRGIEIPIGGTDVPIVNRSLDANRILSESLQMIEGILPALETVDVTQLTVEQASEYRNELAIYIGKLRTLARTLRRIEATHGNTSTEANAPEADHPSGSPEVGQDERPEGLHGGSA